MTFATIDKRQLFVILWAALCLPFVWMIYEGYSSQITGKQDFAAQWGLAAFIYLIGILSIIGVINFVKAVINDQY